MSRCRSWLRVIVEKPFGKDLESSEELAAELARWYPEEQVQSVEHKSRHECCYMLSPCGFSSTML